MNQNTRILVVDDDKEIVGAIAKLLELEGYQILKAYNGLEALDIMMANEVQLIILDIMMPSLDGLSTTMKIREKHNIPIIILSAKTEDTDKILGLSIGADDYVSKPYNPQVLVARVKSQLRRYLQFSNPQSVNTNTVQIGGLELNTENREVSVDGEHIRLTATEYKILHLLMSHPGRVFPSEEIYERVWEEPAYSVENTVMVHIRRIREKIEVDPKFPRYLKVVWGIGYKIENDI